VEGGVEGDVDEGSEDVEEGVEGAEASCEPPLHPAIVNTHVARRNQKNVFIGER
jgi:hypothetical protein